MLAASSFASWSNSAAPPARGGGASRLMAGLATWLALASGMWADRSELIQGKALSAFAHTVFLPSHKIISQEVTGPRRMRDTWSGFGSLCSLEQA